MAMEAFQAILLGLKSNSSKDSLRIPKVGIMLGLLLKWSTYQGLEKFHKQHNLGLLLF